MRLIDADELIYMTIGEEENQFCFVPTEFIKEAETVEAIPIEWIEKWTNSDWRRNSWLWEDTGSRLFRAMIDEWRKEHEIN